MTEEQERAELGRRLRGCRSAQGRTLASVAVEAGLSVPYVANLENGRGNPTLSALRGLAQSLDVPIGELLREERSVGAAMDRLPASLRSFAAGPRFQREVDRLARESGAEPSTLRPTVLSVMAAMTQLPVHFDELDWHRVLDLVVLLHRHADPPR